MGSHAAETPKSRGQVELHYSEWCMGRMNARELLGNHTKTRYCYISCYKWCYCRKENPLQCLNGTPLVALEALTFSKLVKTFP